MEQRPPTIAQEIADKMSVCPGRKATPPLSPALQQRKAALIERYPSRQDFLLAMNPSAQHLAAANEERAWFGNAPSLALLNHAYGSSSSAMWLLPQLFDLSEFCGCREKMDEQQAIELARIITSEYGYLKASELMLFFYYFKAGRYGRFYGAVDPLVITTTLREDFLPEREHAIDKREKEKLEAEREASHQAWLQERKRARAEGRPLYPEPPEDHPYTRYIKSQEGGKS